MQYDSPRGKIAIKWEEQGKRLYVKVPFDTEAIVNVPWKEDEIILSAGEYVLNDESESRYV